MNKIVKLLLLAFALFGALGVAFSAVSTYDFVAHLDRQVHDVTCSFIPGGATEGAGTASGCFAVMMSPYSSVLRDSTWGGVPIALPSLSVFAFLFFFGIVLLVKKNAELRPAHVAFAVAAAALPTVVSIIYWGISVSAVGAVCKNCVGIYVSSFGALVAAAAALFLSTRRPRPEAAEAPAGAGTPWGFYGLSFVEGVLFVAVPLAVFLAMKPAYTAEMARCGELMHPEDKYEVRVALHRNPGGAQAIELVDPLCPACKAFRDRLAASGLIERLDLEGVMFPLDKTCNWMVSESLHPGACAVSEAVLCAGDRAEEVLDWSLDNHEALRQLAAADPKALTDKIKAQFPFVAECVGKPAIKTKVNRSLRWIISNSSRVMTPQLFVNGVKLCDEDSDLGLEFALKRLLSAEGSGRPAPAPAAGR
jgi:uncharacterized membrane protein